MDGAKKRVLGVPVFPGPSAAAASSPSAGRASDAAQQHAGPYSAVVQQLDEHRLSVVDDGAASGSPSTNNGGLQWKLRHIDFSPNVVKGKKDDEHERFPALVERANQWSAQNPQALVFSCETITWTGMERPIFTDSGVLQKSMYSDKKTKCIRGLRVWYVVYDETFYDVRSPTCPGPFKLGYINYTLSGKNDNFQGLLARVNADMFKKAVSGKIMKIETLYMLSDAGEADICAWTEQPDKSRDYVAFMRMFYLLKKDGQEDTKYGEIGVCDFVPQFDQRTPLNQGYEVYADLWRRAARWMYITPGVRFISAQGLVVKVKKESDASQSSLTTLWDRCNHREHGSAYGSLTHQKTEYIQLLRIVYHQLPGAAAANGAPGAKSPLGGAKLYYKSFTPCALRRVQVPGTGGGGGGGGGGGDDADGGPLEGSYEDLRQLEDKINAWLSYTGARVHGVETVPTRLLTGGQEMLGPEATFIYNDREKNQGREYWRVNIRLYLDGEFKDIPYQVGLQHKFSISEVSPRFIGGSMTSLD